MRRLITIWIVLAAGSVAAAAPASAGAADGRLSGATRILVRFEGFPKMV